MEHFRGQGWSINSSNCTDTVAVSCSASTIKWTLGGGYLFCTIRITERWYSAISNNTGSSLTSYAILESYQLLSVSVPMSIKWRCSISKKPPMPFQIKKLFDTFSLFHIEVSLLIKMDTVHVILICSGH